MVTGLGRSQAPTWREEKTELEDRHLKLKKGNEARSDSSRKDKRRLRVVVVRRTAQSMTCTGGTVTQEKGRKRRRKTANISHSSRSVDPWERKEGPGTWKFATEEEGGK